MSANGTTMDEAYRRDYEHKRLCQEAERALVAVLQSDYRVHGEWRELLEEARKALADEARHIVAVWD